ncbi:MAG: metallophosphoesterase [Nannocystaceae bacterium]
MSMLLLRPRPLRAVALLVGVALLPACGDDSSATSGATADTTTEASSSSAGTDGSASQTETASAGTTASSGSASDSMTGSSSSSSTSTSSSTSSDPTGDPSTGPGTSTTGVETTGPSTTTGDPTTGGVDEVVRFVVLGDTGEGNEDQYSVAQAIVEICAQKGCDFAVLTGDNFYDSGVDGTDDPQWQNKFEMPYEDFTFPIYAVLGNHDYGGNGIGVDFDTKKSDYQVQYTKVSQLWKMPAKYYSFDLGPAIFFGLDTNQVMTDPINGNSDPQKNWLVNAAAASNATWKIAFGHHPYISNGDHGNAGSYENLEGIPLPFVTGENVKDFMEEAVCGKIDVYVSGHDHNLQWLMPKCGTEFIVSGAGSKAEDLPGNNPSFYQVGMMEGFLWVELDGNTFNGALYDKNANELYTRSFVK